MKSLNKVIVYFLGEEAAQDKGELITAIAIAILCAFLLPLM
jgi:asparagine N-glycosylation enzyme membrane subunit Stt3